MRRPELHHYPEDELLMYVLGEDPPESAGQVSLHLAECSECEALRVEVEQVLREIQQWSLEEIPEESWRAAKAQLLELFRRDQVASVRRDFFRSLREHVSVLWEYALENPLATVGYVVVTLAFALQQTIAAFRLDRVLPQTSEVVDLFRQFL